LPLTLYRPPISLLSSPPPLLLLLLLSSPLGAPRYSPPTRPSLTTPCSTPLPPIYTYTYIYIYIYIYIFICILALEAFVGDGGGALKIERGKRLTRNYLLRSAYFSRRTLIYESPHSIPLLLSLHPTTPPGRPAQPPQPPPPPPPPLLLPPPPPPLPPPPLDKK